MNNLTRLVALAALAGAVPATAQDAAPPPPPAPDCELHAWPGSGLRSTYHGWFHGGIVDGAVQGRDGYKKLPDQPLPTARQFEILQAMPLAEIAGLPGYRVVLHDTALDSHTLRRTQGRLQPGAAACYAELAIDDVFFQQDIVDGRFLKVLFRFRQFEGDTASRSFGTYVQEKLIAFPPKTPADDAAPALAELGKAYEQVVRDFGAALGKPAKKKKSR